MILTIDVGNSNIVVGAFDGDTLAFSARLNTEKKRLSDEYAIDLRNIFALYGAGITIDGTILSSVVPGLTPVLKRAIKLVFDLDTLVVGPGIKTGMNIRIDNPSQLGSDILADAVGAFTQYPAPIVIFDLGTASTISVTDENGSILGGAILPGVTLSLNALSQTAAQLPEISMEAPRDIIGTNTIDSMRSGILFGNASMIDGMIDRLTERLGKTPTVVATGGIAETIVPLCKHSIILDPALQLKGLLRLYRKNRP
jgi:type III pantothenate kinase